MAKLSDTHDRQADQKTLSMSEMPLVEAMS